MAGGLHELQYRYQMYVPTRSVRTIYIGRYTVRTARLQHIIPLYAVDKHPQAEYSVNRIQRAWFNVRTQFVCHRRADLCRGHRGSKLRYLDG